MRGKRSLERITTSDNPGVGVNFFTAPQAAMREAARGRGDFFPADPLVGAHAPASKVNLFEDGTADVYSLECDPDGWFDYGGHGGVDVAAGRV